jgi:methionine-rich copper-binding protein CopC
MFLVPLLSACTAVDPNGVWALGIPVLQFDDDACEEVVEHNFKDAEVVDEDEAPSLDSGVEIDEETTTEGSNQLVMALISTSGKETAVMVVGNEAWPGRLDGTNTYTFEWTTTSQSSVSRDAAEGSYEFDADSSSETVQQISLEFSEQAADGTLTVKTTSTASYEESDTWNEDTMATIGRTGDIPASRYLTLETDIGARAAQNQWDKEDCDGTCELGVTTTCTASGDVSGGRTGLDAEGFAGVEGAGQTAGGVGGGPP